MTSNFSTLQKKSQSTDFLPKILLKEIRVKVGRHKSKDPGGTKRRENAGRLNSSVRMAQMLFFFLVSFNRILFF